MNIFSTIPYNNHLFLVVFTFNIYIFNNRSQVVKVIKNKTNQNYDTHYFAYIIL